VKNTSLKLILVRLPIYYNKHNVTLIKLGTNDVKMFLAVLAEKNDIYFTCGHRKLYFHSIIESYIFTGGFACFRLLDKLLVVCPNVDYCEEVLPRAELQAHLTHRCTPHGSLTIPECFTWHLMLTHMYMFTKMSITVVDFVCWLHVLCFLNPLCLKSDVRLTLLSQTFVPFGNAE